MKAVNQKADTMIHSQSLQEINSLYRTCCNDVCWYYVIYGVRPKYDVHKLYFISRVVDAWNSLHNWVVSANNTNVFKKLDQHWQHQDIIYDFLAQIEDTGVEAVVRF